MEKQHVVICIATLCTLFSLTGCNRERNSMIDKLKMVEMPDYADGELSKASIDELKSAITALENEVERTVRAGERLGTYYKMVAIRFLDQNMFELAFEHFRKALDINSANPFLAYYAGLCIAQLAQSVMEPAERERLFDRAEQYYLYAVKLDGKYTSALYALSVLYIFEMDRPMDAEVYLKRILARESRHFDAMFLLARVYVSYGRVDDAIDLYDEIETNSESEETVEKAIENRRILSGGSDVR